ncbi:G10 family protein [Besnoitia besnoiti]|uniref:G10 family protein n=1 Tax=Besnoitia besnoiti TaxID=94643 RepID=A0A2A9MNV9_BESBE|nr:G10 family protein [Besnoitia besnoiti]PFH38291.1 G10 family protein [Besnoitia besnoiti]
MPKIRTLGKNKKPPEGWELLEPTLIELNRKMREAEMEPHEGKRKCESSWPLFKLHHQRSRYIYDCYYKRKAISKELYEYCLREGYADAKLIAKWKKPGYEKLCCLRCIQASDQNFSTTCICRVPKNSLSDTQQNIQCVHCGCRGCASGD